jgi:ABC-2 type transport system permease protein
MAVATSTMFAGGMSTITDRLSGNLKSFLITPINKAAILISKILSGVTQAVFSGMIAILIGFAFGAQIAMGLTGFIWIVVICILLSLGLGSVTMILTAKINKIEVYALIVQAIIMPLWFLAGAFFPISALPSWMQPVSNVDPLTYATNGIRAVMLNGYIQLNAMALDLGVLIAFAAVMLLLSFLTFKDTIE